MKEANKVIEHMERTDFLALSTDEVAKIVRTSGTKVCVFPFNGTRRWYLMQHGASGRPYVEAVREECIRLYQLLFDHGIESIITPIFSSEIFNRGEKYMAQIGASMQLLVEDPSFRAFYQQSDVHVHFYGNHHQEFANTKYAYISDLFGRAAAETAANKAHGLFYGVFANDATQAIADFSANFHKDHGRPPTRRELVEMYYGRYLEEADLFIGFGKFKVYDYPMLNLGRESLYFTAAPSLFMNESLLREILYDHIYLRHIPEPDYSSLTREELEIMQRFYTDNREVAFGVGHMRGKIWYEKSKFSESYHGNLS